MSANGETPDAWDANCETKQVKVEVAVDPTKFYGRPDENVATLGRTWVEIPTTDVELSIEKDGPANINRTAKVVFPTEWAGESVVDMISAYQPEDEGNNLSYCRIYFRDKEAAEEVAQSDDDEEIDDSWTLKHHGFIGGVGQTSKTAESKMWVYDFSEMMEKVPFTASWNTPSIDSVTTALIEEFRDETGANIIDTVLYIDEGADIQEVPAEDLEYTDPNLEQNRLNVEKISFRQGDTYVPRKKSFFRDRHTMKDALDWLTEQIDAIWYIRPTQAGGQFVFDQAGDNDNFSRELFIQDSIGDETTQDLIEDSVMDDTNEIRVIQNTALYEINPINTVIVRGQGDTSRDVPLLGDISRFTDIAKTSPSGKFPVATVRAQHLYESAWRASDDSRAAQQAHLERIESTEIEEAIRVAKKKLIDILEQEEEGMIKTYGNPDMEPYDVLESHYTCSERFPTDIVPIHYEIEEVRHKASGPESYKCTCYVSIFVGEQRIVVDQEGTGLEDIDSGEFENLEDEELEEAIEDAE